MAQQPGKSTATLVSETIEDTLTLVRKEIELARIGIIETVSSKLKAAGIVGLGVLLVLPGLLFLFLGVALWLPFSPQADLTIFGGALLALAGVGIWAGARKIKHGDSEASEALEQVKEDARWVRERVKR